MVATLEVAVAGSAPASAASGGAAISPWIPGDGALPANADEDPLVTLTAVACPTDGSCVAVGDYTDTSGNQQGLIEASAGGTWSASEAPLPPPLVEGSDPFVSLGAVTCPTDGSCVATGNYTDGNGDQEGLIETLAGGQWTPVTAPLPISADGNPLATLNAPACPSADACVVTGDFTDTTSVIRSTIDTLSGTWTGQPAPLPIGASAAQGSTIGAASCPAVGSCVAMANYNDTAGNAQSAIETLSGGLWSADEAPLPADEATSHERNLLGSVTCSQVGDCVAVGSFTPASGNFQGLIETLSGGMWTATDAPLPANAPADAFASLGTVTCATTDSCVAFGWYYDSSADYHVMSTTLTEGQWMATEQATPSHPSARNPTNPE
ncbi:MAG: hypothetical protein ACRDY1_08225, partial [Acidimicrobiales bacterium]